MFALWVCESSLLDALPHPLRLDDANVELEVVSHVQVSSPAVKNVHGTPKSTKIAFVGQDTRYIGGVERGALERLDRGTTKGHQNRKQAMYKILKHSNDQDTFDGVQNTHKKLNKMMAYTAYLLLKNNKQDDGFLGLMLTTE